jgi:ABC-2 type transport system permease protein
MFAKVRATFVRDARLVLSYRLWFGTQLFTVAASVTSLLWFVSHLVPPSASFGFKGTPTSYFDFAVVNIAFLAFQATALGSFERSIRDSQVFGTLEATFATPTSVGLVVLGSGAWAFALTILTSICYLLFGMLFGMRLDHVNLLTCLVFLGLTITATAPIGIISAAAVMALKQGAPVQLLFNTAASIFAGVLFPISVLPAWLQYCSWLLPITHALNGIRAGVQGARLVEVAPDLSWLCVASLFLLPCALWIFARAVARAKFDGTLAQY